MRQAVLSLGRLVPVTQMTSMREIKTHESVMWSHNSLVDLKIGRATTQALNIDTPLLRIQMESFESTRLAYQLN